MQHILNRPTLVAWQARSLSRRDGRAMGRLNAHLLRDVGLEFHPTGAPEHVLQRLIWHGPVALTGDILQARRR